MQGRNWFREKSGAIWYDDPEHGAVKVCGYPNCDCHFGYQEEGSDNCPQLHHFNTQCHKLGDKQWSCTKQECKCHLKDSIDG